MPNISPTSLGSPLPYTISASKRVIADLSLDLPASAPYPTFVVQYPAGTAGVQVTLKRGATETLDLLPGPIDNNNLAFASRRVIASAVNDGLGNTILTCEI